MIPNLPAYISVIFAGTTFATLLLFYRAIRNTRSEAVRKKSNFIFFVLIIWLAVQAILTINDLYNSNTNSFPPKLLLFGILPPVVTIILLFITIGGRRFIDSLSLKNITYIHTIRIPVEIVLLWLYLNKVIPQLMTFEGRNFDMLAGITAPFIAYYGFTKNKLSRNFILAWNVLSLALLINIVVNALLSAPFAIQQFAFDQPDIAILYFPFSWLPVFVVPVVLFGHLVSIRQLLKK